ncbi:MAG: hypothetical protein Q8N91_03900 [Candidatus Omnitrophota bacterium]|nr:hypothetical protein [Candidatus Omnitrophota bacterium]
MIKKLALFFLASCFIFNASIAVAYDDSEIILKLLIKKGLITENEVTQMRQEIAVEKAKAGAAEAPKTTEARVAVVEKDLLSKVGLDKISSRLKLKGRAAVGYFDSDERGSFNNGSFQVPEAKMHFTFLPDDINQVIMRLNLNNAVFNSVDYLYLDTNIMKLTPWEKGPFTLSSRIGEFKADIGEETWSNNMVEGILPSNSAANVGGYDEGLQFFGTIGRDRPLGWSFTAMNGNSGTGADTNWLKSLNVRMSYNLFDPLYVSASYYNSGNLGEQSSAISIGGISTPPAGAVKWVRQILEGDIRYDIKKGKVLNPPAYCDSLAYIKGAYGYFYDNAAPTAPGRGVLSREGTYGFVESLINITKKFYVAGRVSAVALSGVDNTAAFNNITCNLYERYSLGMGYRLSNATILKASYDINVEKKGAGGEDPKNNLLSAIIASQF